MALGVGSLFAFLGLALLVRFELVRAIDRLAARLANRLDGPSVELVGELLTETGRIELTLLLALATAGLLWWRARRLAAAAVLLVFATVLVEVLSKELLFVPRSEVAEAVQTHPRRLPIAIVRIFADPDDAPYPSGHMARAVFLCGLLGWAVASRSRLRPFRVFVCVGIVLFLAAMGITRITEGEHPFSDVVGGTLLAMALLPVAWWLLERDRHTSHTSRVGRCRPFGSRRATPDP